MNILKLDPVPSSPPFKESKVPLQEGSNEESTVHQSLPPLLYHYYPLPPSPATLSSSIRYWKRCLTLQRPSLLKESGRKLQPCRFNWHREKTEHWVNLRILYMHLHPHVEFNSVYKQVVHFVPTALSAVDTLLCSLARCHCFVCVHIVHRLVVSYTCAARLTIWVGFQSFEVLLELLRPQHKVEPRER